MKSESKSAPHPHTPSPLSDLQAEQLETRLNLSTLGYHFGLQSGYQSLAALRELQPPTRVISLTHSTDTTAPAMAAKTLAAQAKSAAGKTLIANKTISTKTKTPAPEGVVTFQPFRPPVATRPQVQPTSAMVVTTNLPATPTPSTPTTPSTPATTPTPTVTTTPTSTTTTPPTTTASTPTTTTSSTQTTPTTPAPTSTTTTSNTTVSSTTSSPSLPAANTPDPLAPILAKLYGDDIHDDSSTIQELIDTAYANGYSTINLPAGTFKLDSAVHFYGSGITLTGQGASTILDVASNYGGPLANNPYGNGDAFRVFANLDSNHLMIKQAVTGNTIVFNGAANVTAGETLFLENGKGSTALIEKQLGGQDTGPGAFNEVGPDEYVTVASVATDANGDTVATLTQSIVGTGEYSNVSPTGVSSVNYLNAVSIDTPAQNLTLENFNVKFSNMNADDAFYIVYANHITANNIQVLNSTTAGGEGVIGVTGSMNCTFANITSPNAIGLNTTRLTTIENCSVQNVAIEESSTDNLITNNTITDLSSWGIRINDMACARNTIQYNTIYAGTYTTGAIALMEGVDTLVAHNTCIGKYAGIWTSISQGDVFDSNVAPTFSNFISTDAVMQLNNSWQ